MGRGKSLPLACLLLLGCLTASATAAGVAKEEEQANDNTKAVYDCPNTPRMKGCAAQGCELQLKGRASMLVCGRCMDDKAYTLVNAGTRKAQCECAPGYAGKGMDGVCKKCPADTDIALGGPLAKSICAKCPKGSYVNAEGDECMCPAGHYMTAADQPLGFVRIACKPCIARAAYMAEDGHTFESCSLCRAPLVANKDHTGCVNPEDQQATDSINDDAEEDSESGGSSKHNSNPLNNLANAFEQGRMEAQGSRSGSEGRGGLKALAGRLFGNSAKANHNGEGRHHGADQAQQLNKLEKQYAHSNKDKQAQKQAQQAEEEEEIEQDEDAEQQAEYKLEQAKVDAFESEQVESKKQQQQQKPADDPNARVKWTPGQSKSSSSSALTIPAPPQQKSQGGDDGKGHHTPETSPPQEQQNPDAPQRVKWTPGQSKSSSAAPTTPPPQQQKSHGDDDGKDHEDGDGHQHGGHGRDVDREANAEPGLARRQQSRSAEPVFEPGLVRHAPVQPAEPSGLKQQEKENRQQPSADKQQQQQPEKKEDKPAPKKWDSSLPKEELASQLIPGLVIDKSDFADPDAPPAPIAGAPATGAPSLVEWFKNAGKAFGVGSGANAVGVGSMGGYRAGLGNMLGFVDPSALEDAGLPPVNNLGALMGAIVQKQIGDLDISEWKDGIRGRSNDDPPPLLSH